jgi:hypothetical protein
MNINNTRQPHDHRHHGDGNPSTTPLINAALSQIQVKLPSFSTTSQQSIIRLNSPKNQNQKGI